GSKLSAKTDWHKLYYHKLGTPQSEDQLVFGETEAEKNRYVGGSVTEDNQFLVISASNSTSGNKLFVKDLTKPDSKLITVMDNYDWDTYVIDSHEGKLYMVTNHNSPNKKIVVVNAANPGPENWED